MRGYKVALDLNKRQRTAGWQHAGAARGAYHSGLRRKSTADKATGQSPAASALQRALQALKKTPGEEGGGPWR